MLLLCQANQIHFRVKNNLTKIKNKHKPNNIKLVFQMTCHML